MKRLYKGGFLSTLITFKLFSQLTTDGHVDERGTANGRGQQSRRVEVGTRRPWQGSKDKTTKRRSCFGIQSFNSGACVSSLQDHHRRLPYGTRGVGYVARGASSGEDQNQEHPHKVQHPHHQGRNDHQSTRVIGQHKREESVIQPHGTCWREPYLRADGGAIVCSRGTAASRSFCHLSDEDDTLVQAEQVCSTDGDGQGPTRGQGASSALRQGLLVIQNENLQSWSSAMFQLPEVRASGRFMHPGSTDLSILSRSAHKQGLQREDRHHPEMFELQRTPRNDFHELSGKKERSRVHGPDCRPDKASYGSTQEASKEDRRDICTSSTGLSRQYQCCRDPQLQAIRSEHPIYATQETSRIGLSTAAEGSSTTEGRTVQTLYMGKTEDIGQTARGRGTGTSYNHSGTSGSLESVGRHQTRESSADSSFDQDDRGSSRCNQTTEY